MQGSHQWCEQSTVIKLNLLLQPSLSQYVTSLYLLSSTQIMVKPLFFIMKIVSSTWMVINIPFIIYFKHWCNEEATTLAIWIFQTICYKMVEYLSLMISPRIFTTLHTIQPPRSKLSTSANYHILLTL